MGCGVCVWYHLESVVAEVAAEEGLLEVRHHLGGPDHHAADRHQLQEDGRGGEGRWGDCRFSVCVRGGEGGCGERVGPPLRTEHTLRRYQGLQQRPQRLQKGVVRTFTCTYLVDVGGVEVAHTRVDAQVEDPDLDAGLALARAVQVVVDVVHHLQIPRTRKTVMMVIETCVGAEEGPVWGLARA